MADATSDQTTATTTTDETAAGAADTSTETTGKPASGESAESSAAADKGDDQATQEDGSDGQGEGEGAGDSASKADETTSDKSKKAEQNREAGKLRIAAKNTEGTEELRKKLETDYVDEAESDSDRRLRQIEVDRYVEKAERAQDDLRRDNELVSKEIDVFNPGSESFNKELLDHTMKRYARDCVIQDENGVITGYRIPLRDYFREVADVFTSGSRTQAPKQDAAAKDKADKAKMDAAAEDSGGSSAAAAEAKQAGKGDNFDDLFLAGMDDPNARHKPANTHTFSTS